jgi:hypothetical protein
MIMSKQIDLQLPNRLSLSNTESDLEINLKYSENKKAQ